MEYREVAVPERLLYIEIIVASHCSFNSDLSSWPFYSEWWLLFKGGHYNGGSAD